MATARGERLRDACKRGDLATVQRLMGDANTHKPEAEIEEDVGRQGLMMASANGHVSIAEFLLEHDVPVDATASNGWTSLMGAAMADSGDVVELLLSHGTRVDKQRPDGYTALLLASEYGRAEAVRALLKGGANVNLPNKEGWTPTMKAAPHHAEVLKMLLAKKP